MNKWERAYQAGFKIDTKEPSKIVRLGLQLLPPNSHLLDIGCGNGRNSIYAANLGHIVDAVDIVDLGFHNGLSPGISGKIRFYPMSIFEFPIRRDSYGAVIMTRFIRSFSLENLHDLFGKLSYGLSDPGLLLISYVASGGIPPDKLDVDKFEHKVMDIERLLNEEKIKIIHLEKGDSITEQGGCSYPIESYDIIAAKQKSIHPI